MHRALLAQRYHNLAHGRGPSTARASNLPPDQTSQEQATALHYPSPGHRVRSGCTKTVQP